MHDCPKNDILLEEESGLSRFGETVWMAEIACGTGSETKGEATMENEENRQQERAKAKMEPASIIARRRKQLDRNDELLAEFAQALFDTGTMEDYIDLQCEHMDVFLNLFLAGGYVDHVYSMEEGIDHIIDFMGYWLIHFYDATNAIAIDYGYVLKRFYIFQRGRGRISKEDYIKVRDTVDLGIRRCLDACKKYEEDDSIFLK